MHQNAVTCLSTNEKKSLVGSGGLDALINIWFVENGQLNGEK